jgi:hypothetical protein
MDHRSRTSTVLPCSGRRKQQSGAQLLWMEQCAEDEVNKGPEDHDRPSDLLGETSRQTCG